jgi:hypothetical protein
VSAAAEALLAELRALGVEVVAAGDRLRFKPVSGVTPELRERMLEHKDALLALVRGTPADAGGLTAFETPALAAAKAELRAMLDRADRVEAAARARCEAVPDPDDPSVFYWDWYDRQPDPPPPDAGPWPKQTVVVDVDDDGRIVSGPLCDADGREVLP